MLLKVPSVPYKATSIIKKIDVLRLMSETDEKKRDDPHADLFQEGRCRRKR